MGVWIPSECRCFMSWQLLPRTQMLYKCVPAISIWVCVWVCSKKCVFACYNTVGVWVMRLEWVEPRGQSCIRHSSSFSLLPQKLLSVRWLVWHIQLCSHFPCRSVPLNPCALVLQQHCCDELNTYTGPSSSVDCHCCIYTSETRVNPVVQFPKDWVKSSKEIKNINIVFLLFRFVGTSLWMYENKETKRFIPWTETTFWTGAMAT